MPTYTCRDCGKVFSVPDWLRSDIFCPACRQPISKQTVPPPDSGGAHAEKRSARADQPPAPKAPAPLGVADVPTVRTAPKAISPAVPSPLPVVTGGLASIFRGQNKFLLFGLIGALGCSLGALFGEPVLLITRIPPAEASPTEAGPAQAVCILLDCSGSMESWGALFSFTTKLSEVKSAAKEFAKRQSGTPHQIAAVGFGANVHRAGELTTDTPAIERAIDGLHDGGWTDMGAALKEAATLLKDTPLPRNILLFTDGMPHIPGLTHQEAQDRTLRAAEECRNSGIKIVAIATGDADVGFLARITGDPSLVIPVTAGHFGQGFEQAAKKIYGRSLVELSPSDVSLKQNLLRVGGWTAMLGLGLSLALIAGQNLYLGHRFLSLRQGCVGTVGGLAAGLVAGAGGQLLFSPFSITAFLQSLATVVGWSVLGALIGRGIAYFVPNLPARRAWIGGGIGGGVSGIAFLLTATWVTDIVGRLLGAAMLGLVIGFLITWIEATFREAWLEICFGPREIVKVSLGEKPVSIGSDAKACTVFVFGAAPIALRYWVKNGIIECEDLSASQTMQVRPGNQRQVGNATVTVCGVG